MALRKKTRGGADVNAKVVVPEEYHVEDISQKEEDDGTRRSMLKNGFQTPYE